MAVQRRCGRALCRTNGLLRALRALAKTTEGGLPRRFATREDELKFGVRSRKNDRVSLGVERAKVLARARISNDIRPYRSFTCQCTIFVSTLNLSSQAHMQCPLSSRFMKKARTFKLSTIDLGAHENQRPEFAAMSLT